LQLIRLKSPQDKLEANRSFPETQSRSRETALHSFNVFFFQIAESTREPT